MNKEKSNIKIKLNCDQVSWINDIFSRFERIVNIRSSMPNISRLTKMARISALLELMEVLNLEFDNKYTAKNALCGLPEFEIILQDDPSEFCKKSEYDIQKRIGFDA